ncbi:NB-ARC domain-containing protein [Chloroflexota bacterium]
MLQNQENEELLETLFYYIGNRRIAFVFDNIDRYIDMRALLPIGGVDKLVHLALNKEHNCKFLFTCRPHIKYVGVGFYDLNIEGLTPQDALNLFEGYKISMKKEDVVDLTTEAHQLTSGHPLWLNLIAAQALRGKDTAIKFIDRIKLNRSRFLEEDFSILSERILKTVWDNSGAVNELQPCGGSLSPW